MRVTDLQCESRTSPIDLDTATPRFSWVLQDDTRGQKQTGYRVLVASSADLLRQDRGDLWDSGQVRSADTLQIAYAGRAISPFQQCHWKVQAWNKDDAASNWSEPATFATGPLTAADWTAQWITGPAVNDAPPLFRRAFSCTKPVARATIYVCGLGQFELSCNGRRVGDDVMQPGWTKYNKTCQYVAHDLTPLLKQGDNALGVMIGHGMYHVGDPPAGQPKRYTKFKGSFGPPVLIAQLHIDYADGSRQIMGTDEQWQTSAGPIVYSNIYGGEDYDARREQPGWDTAAFAATDWKPATHHTGPGGTLRGSSVAAPPIRIARVFKAKQLAEPKPGVFVFDSGQNCSMFPRVTVRGPAGSSVKIWPGESLNRDGSVSQKSSGTPTFFRYVLAGTGDESWSPRFSYTGARYFQIEAVPPAGVEGAARPTIVGVESHHLTGSSPTVGTFKCSNDIFTRTAGLIDWAARSNLVSTLTDCPHREKLGWLEEQHLMGPSLMYAYNLHALSNKLCADHTDSQHDNGHVPTICPEFTKFGGNFGDSPEWGSSAVLVPWQTFQWYGDEALLRRQYPTMKRYVDYLTARAKDHIVSHGLGDWYDLGPKEPGYSQLTAKGLTATAIYFHDAEILAIVAKRLGFADDAAAYMELAGKIRDAFNRKFYDGGTHHYGAEGKISQTSMAMPLVLGIAPDEDRAAVLENLVADVVAHDNGLTSGDVGYRYLLRALAAAGRNDVIFAMNNRGDRPGYGMMLAKGATSLTEAWDARPESSQNHFMLGHIQEWLYADLAGLGQAPDSVAFDKIVIQPNPVGDVTRAKASYKGVRGEIRVSWSITDGTLTLECTIPPNTTAVVYVPTKDGTATHEGDKPAADVTGVRSIGNAIFEVQSGTYRFTAPVQ